MRFPYPNFFHSVPPVVRTPKDVVNLMEAIVTCYRCLYLTNLPHKLGDFELMMVQLVANLKLRRTSIYVCRSDMEMELALETMRENYERKVVDYYGTETEYFLNSEPFSYFIIFNIAPIVSTMRTLHPTTRFLNTDRLLGGFTPCRANNKKDHLVEKSGINPNT